MPDSETTIPRITHESVRTEFVRLTPQWQMDEFAKFVLPVMQNEDLVLGRKKLTKKIDSGDLQARVEPTEPIQLVEVERIDTSSGRRDYHADRMFMLMDPTQDLQITRELPEEEGSDLLRKNYMYLDKDGKVQRMDNLREFMNKDVWRCVGRYRLKEPYERLYNNIKKGQTPERSLKVWREIKGLVKTRERFRAQLAKRKPAVIATAITAGLVAQDAIQRYMQSETLKDLRWSDFARYQKYLEKNYDHVGLEEAGLYFLTAASASWLITTFSGRLKERAKRVSAQSEQVQAAMEGVKQFASGKLNK